MNIYETCPTLKSERFILRLFQDEDCNDLLKVYSDKNALPFFNSDNCDGDNFYYATEERMAEAIRFWIFRVDVRSDYEQEESLYDIFSLVTSKTWRNVRM